MSKETESACCVSGSFNKFKDIIDLAIDELEGLGVAVLEPDKGWVIHPKHRILTPQANVGFRPLPSEIGMTIKDIEDSFLRGIAQSDFLYVVDPEGYVGQTVSMEIGFALALGVPVYSQEQINPNLDLDPLWRQRIKEIKVLSIEEAVEKVSKQKMETQETPETRF